MKNNDQNDFYFVLLKLASKRNQNIKFVLKLYFSEKNTLIIY
jgi:hypothetical protein